MSSDQYTGSDSPELRATFHGQRHDLRFVSGIKSPALIHTSPPPPAPFSCGVYIDRSITVKSKDYQKAVCVLQSCLTYFRKSRYRGTRLFATKCVARNSPYWIECRRKPGNDQRGVLPSPFRAVIFAVRLACMRAQGTFSSSKALTEKFCFSANVGCEFKKKTWFVQIKVDVSALFRVLKKHRSPSAIMEPVRGRGEGQGQGQGGMCDGGKSCSFLKRKLCRA